MLCKLAFDYFRNNRARSVGSTAEPIDIPEQLQPPDYTMTIVGMGIAIMALVAIVGIVLYRKKP